MMNNYLKFAGHPQTFKQAKEPLINFKPWKVKFNQGLI